MRLTSKFLRNTGQIAGDEPSTIWNVVSCDCGLCSRGEFYAVDQPSYSDPDRPRHILRANLEVVR